MAAMLGNHQPRPRSRGFARRPRRPSGGRGRTHAKSLRGTWIAPFQGPFDTDIQRLRQIDKRMIGSKIRPFDIVPAAVLVTALMAAPAQLAGQVGLVEFAPMAGAKDAGETAASAYEDGDLTALDRGRYAVVIDLDRNELEFRKGEIVLWTAPVGTGTGLRLKDEEGEWDFSTPNGVFHVQYKELNAPWIAPDWYFVENGLPVPPPEDEKRFFPGGLGAAAVYIEHDLAIHGTDKPELLGQRVSHGCIRLHNRDALRLFHNLQVGTEVIIVGGRTVPREVVTPEEMMARKNFDPKPKPVPKDPIVAAWEARPTEELREVLAHELELDADLTRWPEVAAILLDRGINEEKVDAITALLSLATHPRKNPAKTEYATYLADAFGRASILTAMALSKLEPEARRAAAETIVTATMELYHGPFEASAAPWPSSRTPAHLMAPSTLEGWAALSAAERAYRNGAAGGAPALLGSRTE